MIETRQKNFYYMKVQIVMNILLLYMKEFMNKGDINWFQLSRIMDIFLL